MRHQGLFAVVVLQTLLAVSAAADTGTRECIYILPSGTQALRLPADGNWYLIGQLTFNNDLSESSDYVIAATLFFTEGNTANTLVEYQFLFDGLPYGDFTKPVPTRLPSSETLRGSITDRPSGTHTLGIRGRILSGGPAYYSGFWLSPLLLPGAESTWGSSTATPVSIGSSYVDLVTLNTTASASKQYLLEAFVTVGSGTTNAQLNYRLLRNGVPLYGFIDSVTSTRPNTAHISYIDTTSAAGAVSYTLQASSPFGYPATLTSRGLAVQAAARYDVMQGAAYYQSVPNDDQWHTVSASGWRTVNPISVGPWGTNGWGTGYSTFGGPMSSESSSRFLLSALQEGWSFEVGWYDLHPASRTMLATLTSDWDQLGLNAGASYKLEKQVVGLCTDPNAIYIDQDEFQVILLPDQYGYHPGSCTTPCTVYACTAGPLPLATTPPRDCFF